MRCALAWGLATGEELLMELHPFAALGYLSALAFHALTEEMPKEITVIIPRAGSTDVLPLDTAVEDWEGISRVRGLAVRRVLDRPVRWVRIEARHYFGLKEYRLHGYPVRVATPERTLLDGLQRPDLCGGFPNVLSAWVAARDLLNLDATIHYVDLFDSTLLRQLGEASLKTLLAPALDSSARRFGMVLPLQRVHQDPSGPDRSFITYEVHVGYALPDEEALKRRISRGLPSSKIVRLEISLILPAAKMTHRLAARAKAVPGPRGSDSHFL